MIPIDQTKLHKPPITGNCMNAAFASILEIDIESIPCFEDMSVDKWFPELLRWLDGIGFYLLRWEQEVYLPCYFIANGPSPRGVEHSVVYKGENMVHDPHPSRAGVEKVTSVWVLIPLDPARFVNKT